MSSCVKVEPVTPAVHCGKGPHWDECTQSLYFVDMFKQTIHRYKPDCDMFTTATVGCGNTQPLAIIVPVEGKQGYFVVSMKNNLCSVQWDGIKSKAGAPQVIQSLEPAENTNRINNGKVDPMGRLWAGTTGQRLSDTELIFEENKAAVYCLKNCSNVVKTLECVSVANGMEWSSDSTKFYFTDSAKYQLEQYNYCPEAPKVYNPKPIFDLKQNNMCGVLDGMAMDCSGKLYIANYHGAQVIVFDTCTCQVVDTIQIPAKEVTSCCWGGLNNDILFVTTGNTEACSPYPCAGRVFKVTGLQAKGVPSRSVKLG